MENKQCSVCNATTDILLFNGIEYCPKHLLQMRRHGEIFKRTRFDPNEIIVYEDYAEIVLYDKYGNENGRTKIDLEDVEICKNHKWHKKILKKKYYVFTRINGKPIRLHRFVLNYYDYDLEIDHINGDSLDNRKRNLKQVTHQQNMMNQRVLPSNNKTGVIGVYFDKRADAYIAQIKINKKNKYLGQFETIEEASIARKDAEKIYFGKFKYANSEEENNESKN